MSLKNKNYFGWVSYILILLIGVIGVKYFVNKHFVNKTLLETTVIIGHTKYNALLAKTLSEKKRGLMFVKKLPKNAGMLFVFHKEVDYPFWMKNTLIPLTVLFINKGNVVNQINMKPCKSEKCKFYYPFVNYRYALEINSTNKKLINKEVTYEKN